MDIVSFWRRVQTQLKAHKISQVQFAKYVGIKPATFNGWIYHNRIPDLVTALNIAAALGVGVEYLAFGKDGEAMEARARQVEERKIAAAKIKKLNREIRKQLKRI